MTAKKATGTGAPPMSTFTSAGSVSRIAITADSTTPCTGTRLLLNRDQYRPPGTAPSRLKANSIRVVLVMQATVQKNWPAAEISRTVPAQREDSAWLKMTDTAPPPLVTPAWLCTANRNDSSRIQPPIPE